MYVSVSERFVKCAEYLIETRKLRNQAELVRLLGLSKGYVSQLMSGKREPSETIVGNLCARFPELNAQWIMTGAGEMTQDVGLRPVEEFIEPNTVPMLPIFAQAGHLTEWSEGIEEAKCERVISPVKDIDMAIHIYGESMSPDIPNGAVCYVRRVTGKVIDYGRAYILDTVDGPVVKYLMPGSDDEHIRCQSANLDPKFAPYEIEKADILGMYRVIMCMKMM
jgi:phage repressor protein C with HTH and peptisase S24 domain